MCNGVSTPKFVIVKRGTNPPELFSHKLDGKGKPEFTIDIQEAWKATSKLAAEAVRSEFGIAGRIVPVASGEFL